MNDGHRDGEKHEKAQPVHRDFLSGFARRLLQLLLRVFPHPLLLQMGASFLLLGVKRVSSASRRKPASAAKCAGLLAATIAGMVAVVGDADSMEPFQRVRVGVTDSVGAHPDQEVVSIREDFAGPADHAVVRRVVPRAAVPFASRRRMDRDRSVVHLELIG